MVFFDRDRRQDSPEARWYYALSELLYTSVDFAAAATFLTGSVLFLFQSWQDVATWFFIVGSVLFALKPTIRLTREAKLAAMGNTQTLAELQERAEFHKSGK